MADRTDPARPTSPGAWPTASTLDRIFDHGAGWCVNAAGHPGDGDYPDAALHIPAFECRSRPFFVDALVGLDGAADDLAIYAARPFRFGEPRTANPGPSTRIVLESDPLRLSISLGDALRVARCLDLVVHIVDHG